MNRMTGCSRRGSIWPSEVLSHDTDGYTRVALRALPKLTVSGKVFFIEGIIRLHDKVNGSVQFVRQNVTDAEYRLKLEYSVESIC